MMRDHGLVRGDKGTGVGQRLAGQCQGRAVRTTDQLDDDIDIVRSRQFAHVVNPAIR